jgi:hypothetical protein
VSAAGWVTLGFASMAIVGVVLVAVVAALRTRPEGPRMPYQLYFRLTSVGVLVAFLGLFGTVSGVAFALGMRS